MKGRVVVDHVKNFGEVNCHGHQHAVWGTGLVEIPGCSMPEGEEGGNDGVIETKSMLGR